MTSDLMDPFRHNAWATGHLMDFCRGLDSETLNTRVPGTYGTILETFNHYLNAEGSYLRRVSHAWPEIPWDTGEQVGFDVLGDRAALLAATWERFVSGEVDMDRMDEARGDDGMEFAVPVSVFITQTIHHSNEHRAQICSALGTLGIEPPEVSGWLYALETGRSGVTFRPDGVTTW